MKTTLCPPLLNTLSLIILNFLCAAIGQTERTQVFILAGQSNMVGHGVVQHKHPERTNGGIGNLEWSLENAQSRERMQHLRDASGAWAVRDDVRVSFKTQDKVMFGPLKPLYTYTGDGHYFGPELQFGHLVGDHFAEPVLLIKTAWGGKSLAGDFRPPSSSGDTGAYYLKMVEEVRVAISRFDTGSYEIAGFVWMQGWNDMIDATATSEYQVNLQNLIADLRAEFNTPNLPVVVGELGNAEKVEFREIQKRATASIPNSRFVETSGFLRDSDLSPSRNKLHHWHGNAESYFLIGDALGEGMIDLLNNSEALTAESELWKLTSNDGFVIQARVSSFKNNAVTLTRADGVSFENIPLARFSEADQKRIQEHFQKPKVPELEAPKSEIHRGSIYGYMGAGKEGVPQEFNAGFSVYTAAWPIQETYPGRRFQSGLFGTWMFGWHEEPLKEKLYSTIEGGLGWWRDTRFATPTPKFIMGGVALNFAAWANGPGAGKGRSWEKPQGKYAVAQLSNRVLWPPDGLNLKQGTCGELFGYGYLPLPLTEPRDKGEREPAPTGNQCWTLFLNTASFKGPLTFFVPDFFSRYVVGNPLLEEQTLDVRPSRAGMKLSLENQWMPTAYTEDASGALYGRVANTLFPKNHGENTIIANKFISYKREALWNSVEAWFNGGAPTSGQIDEASGYVHQFNGGGFSGFRMRRHGIAREQHRLLDYTKLMEHYCPTPDTFGYTWNPQNVSATTVSGKQAYLLSPFWTHKKTSGRIKWGPVQPEDVPLETGLHTYSFPEYRREAIEPYVTPEEPDSYWKSPGPAAGPFRAHLGDGSVVTYYWYRFVDQPAILHANKSQEEREKLQKRIELIHQHWKPNQEFLPPPSVDVPLASLDPALIIEPPQGLEIGYVPIVTRQELASDTNQQAAQ